MKKISFIAVLLVFFFISCSFTYTIFDDSTIAAAMEYKDEDTQVIKMRASHLVSEPKEDITMGENNQEMEDAQEADASYTLEDLILEDENSYSDDTGSISDTDEIYEVTPGHLPEEEREEEEAASDEEDFSRDDWRLILINKQHPIPDNYVFEMGTIKGSMKCDSRIIDDLLKMMQGAKEEGLNLMIVSPYRKNDRQEFLFNRKVDGFMEDGMSYMEAYKKASQVVTIPGSSEHEVGLALDIVSNVYTLLNEGFGDTPEGRWLAEHSHEYGFIVRYPKNKEYITGIEYEPWHFRYVGRAAAGEIYRRGCSLEEFVAGLR